MATPSCAICQKNLPDWEGNVMVDGQEYPQRVARLQVVCKECTRKLDASGKRRDYHNIWELRWVREQPLYLISNMVMDVLEGEGAPHQWDREAVEYVLKLALQAHPTLGRPVLSVRDTDEGPHRE